MTKRLGEGFVLYFDPTFFTKLKTPSISRLLAFDEAVLKAVFVSLGVYKKIKRSWEGLRL